MARLDQVGEARRTAQLGAVIGRQFDGALLCAVSPLDETSLQQDLRCLVDNELLYQRGVGTDITYRFKHALIQDAAYQSLLKQTRQQTHQQVAQVFEACFPEIAEQQPELLAHHYTEADQDETAISYWQRAGQCALQRSAHAEAIAHLTQGLTLLTRLPETILRLQQELDLQIALGPALFATQGNAALGGEHAYARARELCRLLGDNRQIFPVLRGLIIYYQARGQQQTAFQLGEELLRLAQSQHEPALLMLAHHQLGMVLLWRGEPVSAYAHHMQALTIYNSQQHQALALRYGVDLGVTSHSLLAWELWQQGYPDQAIQHSQKALALAREVSHPYSLGQALIRAAVLHQFRREASAAYAQAEAATTLSAEHRFAHRLARGTILHGWALAMQGQDEEGISEMRQGLAGELDSGARAWQPYSLGLLAEAYGERKHPEEGLSLLAEALAVIDSTETRFYKAELYRLKGTFLQQLSPDNHAEAEACFHQALSISRKQQAKSWELRAVMSLARLWQQQGKQQAAYDLLAPVYAWFTEGFDTADLQEAKQLLATLQ